MTQENRLLNEIKKVIDENVDIAWEFDKDELAKDIYELMETTANEYYNTMKINKEEEGTTARFNHWAINHFKK